MAVVGEDFGDAGGAHGVHGNTVGEAVAFVRAGFVERQAAEELLAGLGEHVDVGTGQEIAHESDSSKAGYGSGFRHSSQKLHQDLVNGGQTDRTEAIAGLLGSAAPRITGSEGCDPIHRVHEDGLHRFGVP